MTGVGGQAVGGDVTSLLDPSSLHSDPLGHHGWGGIEGSYSRWHLQPAKTLTPRWAVLLLHLTPMGLNHVGGWQGVAPGLISSTADCSGLIGRSL